MCLNADAKESHRLNHHLPAYLPAAQIRAGYEPEFVNGPKTEDANTSTGAFQSPDERSEGRVGGALKLDMRMFLLLADTTLS